MTGDLKVGQRIPPEIELSESLGVSRSSLREALRILDVLGILEPKTGEGTVIKPAEPENLKTFMSLVILSEGFNEKELYEARMIIEMHANVVWNCKQNSEEDLVDIHTHLVRMDQLFKDSVEHLKWDSF